MRSEPGLGDALNPKALKVDFSRRVEPADLPEWLDEPCTYEELCKYLDTLERVNQLTLASRPTLDWLDKLARKHAGRTLRIVDVGCGGGDMLRRIERWAKRRGVVVELLGIDLNPHAAQVARKAARKDSRIEWLTGDAFAHTEPVDVVVSALLTHHLSEAEVVRFLAWMEATALRGWYINDLCREAVPYRLFRVAGAGLRWHKMVRHDGRVSFRRSFREADWVRMLETAGLDPAIAAMRRWTPGRLCVGRTKNA